VHVDLELQRSELYLDPGVERGIRGHEAAAPTGRAP
jgi:hypothetical protein